LALALSANARPNIFSSGYGTAFAFDVRVLRSGRRRQKLLAAINVQFIDGRAVIVKAHEDLRLTIAGGVDEIEEKELTT